MTLALSHPSAPPRALTGEECAVGFLAALHRATGFTFRAWEQDRLLRGFPSAQEVLRASTMLGLFVPVPLAPSIGVLDVCGGFGDPVRLRAANTWRSAEVQWAFVALHPHAELGTPSRFMDQRLVCERAGMVPATLLEILLADTLCEASSVPFRVRTEHDLWCGDPHGTNRLLLRRDRTVVVVPSDKAQAMLVPIMRSSS